MPNWVYNYLVITGEKEELQKFKTQAVGKCHSDEPQDPPSVLCFENFVPIPFEKIEPGGLNDWEYANWGCKCGACFAFLAEESNSELVYQFRTPNGSPDEFLKSVGKLWPNLKFHDLYFDPLAMRFAWCIDVHGEKSMRQPENMDEALLVWHEEAEAGLADAQCCLGICYADGRGVQKDPAKVLKWWSMAAAQGHVDAETYLEDFIKELSGSRK